MKRLIALLLAAAIPVQGLAALIKTLQGSAHFHEAASAPTERDVHSQAQAHLHTQDFFQPTNNVLSLAKSLASGHTHAGASHQHSHNGIERHYHRLGDGAVIVQDDRNDYPGEILEQGSKGESASPVFLPLLTEWPPFHALSLSQNVAARNAKRLVSCTLRRIERPPRLLFA